jgi:hypothetical protein
LAKNNKKPNPVSRPMRDPDHLSKRGVPYWWSPEWVRGTSAEPANSYGRVKPIKDKNGDVFLYMWGKNGSLVYILGSIQEEFKTWHTDRLIDYILLGEDPDSILESEND